MKKITPIFGPQELFDHAPGGAEFAIKLRPSPNDNIPAKNMYYFYTAERALLFAGENNVAHVAQRRIQEAPDPIDLSGDMDAIIEPEFSEWWKKHGQFIRTGGGDYERTFAFGAFRYLMPRILGRKQPDPNRWTVEDQKAGRLPEVGSRIRHISYGVVEFIGLGVDEEMRWAVRLNSGIIYIADKTNCSPIETPEESGATGG
ncbi:MAG: hypothetical protein PHV54_01520 [Tolumonas sp.]|nr:hypothetical protein [Tolumonas sp.]